MRPHSILFINRVYPPAEGATGTLLATIPMGGHGLVMQSGTATRFEIDGLAGKLTGDVGPGGLQLDNKHISTGDSIRMSRLNQYV